MYENTCGVSPQPIIMADASRYLQLWSGMRHRGSGRPLDRMNKLSIIIPALNEVDAIGATLASIAAMGEEAEVIVVDGGSTDGTPDLIPHPAVKLLRTNNGRGLQLHAGAAAASGDIFWFLHADTVVPADAARRIRACMASPGVSGGNFNLAFDGRSKAAQFLTWLYPNLQKLGLCYGDSGIFIRRSLYEKIGGFQPYPIFEDLDLLRRMRRAGRVPRLPCCLITSSRRFEGRNFPLVFVRWTLMQILYWIGVHPAVLAHVYRPIRSAK